MRRRTPDSLPNRRLSRARRLAARAARVAAVASLALAAGACRDVPPAFGPTVAVARVNADAALTGLARRFVDVHRTPKFERARAQLGRRALTPSKLVGDTSVWTGSAPNLRTLELDGTFRAGRYVFTARPSAAAPSQPGDSRHLIRLRSLGDDQYEWTTSVEHAIGEMRAADAAAVLSALVASPEGRTPQEVRADYRAAFPRTTRTLGRLLAIDSLQTQRLADGSTVVTLGIALHPDRLRAEFPSFAKYVEKYVEPAKYRFTLRDAAGGVWMDIVSRDRLTTLRMRVRDGRLVSLAGAPRPMPDTLQLRMNFTARFMVFDVGFSELLADFVMVREPNARAWSMRFRREPKWHLPLAARHLIRSPLRRPFEGEGASFYLGVRDADDGPTLLERRAAGVVRESAILRWLGALGGRAVGDFEGKAEAEENRFLAEAFDALRQDLRALAGPAPAAMDPAGR